MLYAFTGGKGVCGSLVCEVRQFASKDTHHRLPYVPPSGTNTAYKICALPVFSLNLTSLESLYKCLPIWDNDVSDFFCNRLCLPYPNYLF